MLAPVVSVPLQETAKFEVPICDGSFAIWLVGPLLVSELEPGGSVLTKREKSWPESLLAQTMANSWGLLFSATPTTGVISFESNVALTRHSPLVTLPVVGSVYW